MNTSQSLSQNLSQQQRISPQLQQSLNILQGLLVFELRQMIDQEMAVNPVLEAETPEASEEQEQPERELEDDNFDEEFNRLSALDDEWRDPSMAQQNSATRTPRTSEDEERRQFLRLTFTSPVTPQEHRREQLAMVDCTPEIRGYVEQLIGGLDERGYLQTPIGEMSPQQGAAGGAGGRQSDRAELRTPPAWGPRTCVSACSCSCPARAASTASRAVLSQVTWTIWLTAGCRTSPAAFP